MSQRESRALAAIRDALRPMLLLVEIEVKDIQRMIERRG
jgi:hypothetical protein